MVKFYNSSEWYRWLSFQRYISTEPALDRTNESNRRRGKITWQFYEWSDGKRRHTRDRRGDDNRVDAKRRDRSQKEDIPSSPRPRGIRSNLLETAWNSSGWSARAMTHARNFIAKCLFPLSRAAPRRLSLTDKCRWHAIDPRCLQNNALPPSASSKSVVARASALFARRESERVVTPFKFRSNVSLFRYRNPVSRWANITSFIHSKVFFPCSGYLSVIRDCRVLQIEENEGCASEGKHLLDVKRIVSFCEEVWL